MEGAVMTILGLTPFGWVHTIVSLVMLVAGFVVVKDLLNSRVQAGWMAAFLITGVATSATGFGFPFDRLGDSHYVGIISLVVLALSILGLYAFHLTGPWRWIFALGVAQWGCRGAGTCTSRSTSVWIRWYAVGTSISKWETALDAVLER